MDVVRYAELPRLNLGYVGMRYGREIVAGGQDALGLPLTSLYGLLLEIRGGPAAGLRSYVDIVPQVSQSIKGEDIYFGWKRFLASYSWSYKTPRLQEKMGLAAIEFAPKIGIWDFLGRFPVAVNTVANNSTIQMQSYKVNNGLSLGAEASLLVSYFGYNARVWLAGDTASSSFSGVKSTSVSSKRVGADFFVDGPQLRSFGENWKIAFLAFLSGEQISLSGPDPSGEGTFSLALQTTYAGGGINVTW